MATAGGVGRSDAGDHAGVIGTDRVQAGTELQFRRPHAGIDLHGARDDLGVIGAAGIQAIALDAHPPLATR
jgi:hypothetical protein